MMKRGADPGAYGGTMSQVQEEEESAVQTEHDDPVLAEDLDPPVVWIYDAGSKEMGILERSVQRRCEIASTDTESEGRNQKIDPDRGEIQSNQRGALKENGRYVAQIGGREQRDETLGNR